jgi:hypothetical protein
MTGIVDLHLDGNRLVSPPDLLPIATTLETFHIHRNPLGSFPSDYFPPLRNLKNINIRNCELSVVPRLSGLELFSLAIGGNDLEVHDGDFCGVSVLYLSMDSTNTQNLNPLHELMGSLLSVTLPYNNFAKDVAADLYSLVVSNPGLRHINAEHCHLETFPDVRQLSLDITSTLTIAARDNPFVCDDRMAWTTDVTGFGKLSITDLDEWICDSPPEHQGKRVSEVNYTETNTTNERPLYTAKP